MPLSVYASTSTSRKKSLSDGTDRPIIDLADTIKNLNSSEAFLEKEALLKRTSTKERASTLYISLISIREGAKINIKMGRSTMIQDRLNKEEEENHLEELSYELDTFIHSEDTSVDDE